MPKYIKKIIKQDFLILADKHNIDSITVSQLLAPSGINRKTFYNHFSGIADLICSICIDLNDNTSIFSYENTDWRIQIKNVMKFLSKNENFIRKIIQSKYYSEIQIFFNKHLTITVKTFVENFYSVYKSENKINSELSEGLEEKIVYLYYPAINALIKQWFTNGMKEPVDEYIDTIEKITTGGIFECIKYFTNSRQHSK